MVETFTRKAKHITILSTISKHDPKATKKKHTMNGISSGRFSGISLQDVSNSSATASAISAI